jgi:hypothetical protein
MITNFVGDGSRARVLRHPLPLLLRSSAGASRRMATELQQLMVRDARKGALLTIRDGVTP